MNRIYACPVADVPEGEALRIDTSPVIALFNVPATDPLTTYPVHVEGGDIFIDLPEAQP